MQSMYIELKMVREQNTKRDDLSFMMQLGLAGPALLRQTNTLGHNIL